MNYNLDMFELGNKRSIIREIFEYSKKRKAEIGDDKVFDFSLGNPTAPPPKQVKESILKLLDGSELALHGYTSAQGDFGVRKAVSDNINSRFNLSLTPDNIYMTCGAAASLSISLKAVMNAGKTLVIIFS